MPLQPYAPPSYAPASYLPQDLVGGLAIAPAAGTSFEQDLLTYLNGLGIVAYCGHIPQGKSLPASTFECVSEDPRYSLKSAAGLTARNYQFSAFSTAFDEVVSAEKSLRAALHGFRGMMGSTLVSSCRLQNVLDQYETNADGSDDGTYQRIAEYKVFFKEAVPSF